MEYVFVVITWLGLATTSMQELPMTERQCERMVSRLTPLFEEARANNPEFGFILECKTEEENTQ
jgi:hypothetical protein